MNTTGERLVDDYLARLDVALADVPWDRRREIVEEIEAHLAATVEAAPGAVALREALDRLGEPEEIAAEARERLDPPARVPRRSWLETATIVLLLAGGFLGGVGWVVGVALLWLSDVWTTRDKLIGTLVLPGGLAFPVLVGVFVATTWSSSSDSCSVVGKVVSKGSTHPGPTATVCAHTGGTPRYQQVVAGVLLFLSFALPILTAAYLARRSRPARTA